MEKLTWNPTEYLRRSKNPPQTALNIHAVELWRARSLESWPTDIPTREAIKLESHFRHLVSAFIDARPMQNNHEIANAVVTALAGTLGLVAVDAVKAGMPREQLMVAVMARINAIIDFEIRKDGTDDPQG